MQNFPFCGWEQQRKQSSSSFCKSRQLSSNFLKLKLEFNFVVIAIRRRIASLIAQFDNGD